MTIDYRTSVFLPNTSFLMKAGLSAQEPKWLERWQGQQLYQRLRQAAQGRPKFILHDGPPYANGAIHIGHALNHILKDVVVRSQQMQGKDAPYVPGWDCHGLPIEWKIEEEYRKKGKNKDEVDPADFRAECRAYAQRWVDTQRDQLKRLGIMGDWENPYLTMAFESEATIVRELTRFAMSGQIYRGAKPVMWSPVEKTALAEAEIEYEEITSTQIDVAFPVLETSVEILRDAHVVIWTTTPWTIPCNRALAYGTGIEYAVLEGDGYKLLVAESLIGAFKERTGLVHLQPTHRLQGFELAGTLCAHPLQGQGDAYAAPRPLLAGDFVTTDQGTGIVHMAPDHGEDDFTLCQAHGIEPLFVVEADGRYRSDWPIFGNEHVYKVPPKVCEALGNALLSRADFSHSYPHSWRSKAKLIYRCTPQWFVRMDAPLGVGNGQSLREQALAAIEATRFIPERGRKRIRAMVETRPDWVLSRQRTWGVPIPLFLHKQTGSYLQDEVVNARIVDAVRQQGVDAWYATPSATFLGPTYDAQDYEKVTDILDVWFDSGCTHAFVTEARPELGGREAVQADLYLEGSDQHRGWFQSSLLESCGTRGQAPYKAVMTHGFTMDAGGRKMSKSLGNTIDPLDVVKEHGADILRLWAVSTDYFEDQRIGKEILSGTADAYRKLRNTLRYLLGALAGFEAHERVELSQMPDLERWVLHRLSLLDVELRQTADDFDFNRYMVALKLFCDADLSAFYFDVRKDSLYCDSVQSSTRRACRSVLDILFHALTRYLAPVLVFTAEEAWLARYPDDTGSIHLEQWQTVPSAWQDDALGATWERVRAIRSVVTGALEVDRRHKHIGPSLEAAPKVYVANAEDYALLQSLPFAQICITSGIEIIEDTVPEAAYQLENVPNVGVVTQRAQGDKCARCWQILPDVGQQEAHPHLCGRCYSVVSAAL
jgi:isoleucyl-tRNA synthetase